MMSSPSAMILSLTNDNLNCNDAQLINLVGGKALSLMKLSSSILPSGSCMIPKGFVLTTAFFQEWIDQVVKSQEYKTAVTQITSNSENVAAKDLIDISNAVKAYSKTLELSAGQWAAIEELKNATWEDPKGLLAVRSSATDEDGTAASFAGIYETKLGVTVNTLTDAIRDCFSSLFDYRVLNYRQNSNNNNGGTVDKEKPSFAAVVMEMVDSKIAGVAFSVNPINSDLDELVVDSSWGLGESVVDGSVVPDRYTFNKIEKKLIEAKVGSKELEKRLLSDGGVQSKQVDDVRKKTRTLSDEMIRQLFDVVCLIEEAYEMPMDVEFAFADTTSSESLGLRILQARPITTNFTLDDSMITAPGEPRVLYYDFNVASEATTTEPFTYLDLQLYCKMFAILLGAPGIFDLTRDPEMLLFNSSTRQYINMSTALRWFPPETFARGTLALDPYLSATFASSDCDRKKYKSKKMAKGIGLSNALWLLRQFPFFRLWVRGRKYRAQPKAAKEEYLEVSRECQNRLQDVHRRGVQESEGLHKYIEELMTTMKPALDEEVAAAFSILPVFDHLDKNRREGKTEEIRQEYEAICGGFEGDPVMEINIAMYRLARALPQEIWSEYDNASFDKLAKRIHENINGSRNDIPVNFLESWNAFMQTYGYDSTPQLFVSSPNYVEKPEILLARISHNVGDNIKDPSEALQEKVKNRRHFMKVRESRAQQKCWNSWKLSSIRKENEVLDHLLWIRNVPKMNLSQVMGMMREALISVETKLIQSNRLEKAGDIFHLDIKEIDAATLSDPKMDLMKLVRPRRKRYEKAKRATQCPILVDSRNRILRPDVVEGNEPGLLVGSPISPGVATGKVRIVNDPTEPFEAGEVLVTVVTDPAWTPLFVGAAAIVIQVGGVLQHGALCAREYGKPGVSGIDVKTQLKTGMMVTVDGNTGTVKIHDETP